MAETKYVISQTPGGKKEWIAVPDNGLDMVYPSAGIALSTGSAWGSSIDPATLARLANPVFSGVVGIGCTPGIGTLEILTAGNHAAVFRARNADDLVSLEFASKTGTAWGHIQFLSDETFIIQQGGVTKAKISGGDLLMAGGVGCYQSL